MSKLKPMMLPCPWNGVCRGHNGKCPCRSGLRKKGIANPFQNFTKEICARNILESAAIGDFVATLARSSQCAQNMVGMEID